jgi:hypothetical protein
MKKVLLFPIFLLLLAGCIGDDIIEDRIPEVLRITQSIDTLALGETFQFEASYFNEVGDQTAATINWMSSNQEVIFISESGLAQALSIGQATISAITMDSEGKTLEDQFDVIVSEGGGMTGGSSREGTIVTTSSYILEGSFTLTENGADLILTVGENFKASTALPGLYVYLGNNNTSIASAREISKVNQFEGEHSYQISNVGLREYEYVLFWCKPFNVKVGEGTFNN